MLTGDQLSTSYRVQQILNVSPGTISSVDVKCFNPQRLGIIREHLVIAFQGSGTLVDMT